MKKKEKDSSKIIMIIIIPRPCLRIEKTVEHESNDCANCDWLVRHSN